MPSNIAWTSWQRCVNIVPTLYFDKNPIITTMLLQCWPTSIPNVDCMTVVSTLWQCWKLCNFTTLPQCCDDIAWMLQCGQISRLSTNADTPFTYHCMNVVWTLWFNIDFKRCWSIMWICPYTSYRGISKDVWVSKSEVGNVHAHH